MSGIDASLLSDETRMLFAMLEEKLRERPAIDNATLN